MQFLKAHHCEMLVGLVRDFKILQEIVYNCSQHFELWAVMLQLL